MKQWMLLAAALSALPAHAQEAPASEQPAEALDTIPVTEQSPAKEAPAASDPAPEVRLEEVVVTSTKRVRRLRDLPQSISSLDGEDLERRGAQSAADFLRLVPGVNITETGDSPARVTIRGIASDIGTGASTGVLFGNVSFTDPWVPFVALDPNPFDLQSVEVLKGPQGTLFGAAALNGAVRYVPNAPQFGVSEVRYYGQYTKVAHGDAAPSYGAVANVPFGDAAAIRTMGFLRESPGWIDNRAVGEADANHVDQWGVRGMAGWHPTPESDVAFTYATQSTNAHDPSLSNSTTGGLYTTGRVRLSYNDTRYDLADLSLRYAFDWADLVSETAYVFKEGHNFFEASDRLLPNPPLPLDAQEYLDRSHTWTQEFRLASPAGNGSPWQWVAGVSGYQQNVRQTLQVPLGDVALPIEPLLPILDLLLPGLGDLFVASGEPAVLRSTGDVRVREIALFGDVTRTFFGNFDVSLGGRLYRTSSGGTNAMSGIYVFAQFQKPRNVLEGEVVERGFNPKASLTWRITRDFMTYAAVSKGFRIGGIQIGLTTPRTPVNPNPVPEKFKSDKIWNYEAGVRTQWLHNTLRFDLTGFYEDWTEPQTIQQDSSGLAVYVDNVGGVRSKGVEAALQVLVPFAPGLRLTASGAYADTVTTASFTSAKGTVVPAGSPWALSPKWQSATTLAYVRPVLGWMLSASVTHTFLDKAISDIATAYPVYGYRQWDAQIGISNPSIRWLPELAVTATNLADERGVTNRFSSGVPSPELATWDVYYIQPLAVTVRLMGRFGG